MVPDLGVPRLSALELAALVMLAASLLVFRTFRERYLLVWIVGWLAYFVSRLTLATPEGVPIARYLTAIAQAEFVLAICLFAAAIFVYTHAQKLVPALLLVAITVMAYAVARALLWPDSLTLRVALEVAYRLVAITAVVELIRYRWSRWEIGPWFLGASLLLMHLPWEPVSAHLPPGMTLIATLSAGLSMLLVVFDDYKMRTRRLGVINALTGSITRAQHYGPMMVTALEELKKLMHARAAWFRLREGDHMVVAQQIGLSQNYLEECGSLPMYQSLGQALQEGTPVVVKTKDANENVRAQLRGEKFHHVVIVPVLGKKSVIGILSLGSRRSLTYAPDDMEFLTTTGQQLGLAVENLRLVEQVLRSHRQWANTFDSIHDLVLLHDADFRVMKANHALLERLAQAPADVVGKLCEEVLPGAPAKWSGCPYCAAGSEGFHEGTDQCLWRLLHGLHLVVHRAGKQTKRHHSRGARYHRPAHRGGEIPVAVRAGTRGSVRGNSGRQTA